MGMGWKRGSVGRLAEGIASDAGEGLRVCRAYFGLELRPDYLGLAFSHCALFSIQRTVPASGAGLDRPLIFVGMSALCLLAALAVALRGGRGVSGSRAFGVASCAAAAASAFLLTAGLVPLGSWMGLMLVLVFGAAMGAQYLVWGAFFARMDIRQATLVILLVMALGSLMKLAFQFLEPGLSAACLYCLLPVASHVCAVRARATCPQPRCPRAPLTPRDHSALRRYACGIAVFGVAIGLVRVLVADFFTPGALSGVGAHAFEIVVALGLVILIGRQNIEFAFTSLWLFVLAVIATGLVLLELVGPMLDGAACAVLTASQMLMVTFYWLVLADVAQRSGAHSDVVVGLGYPIYALGLAASMVAYGARRGSVEHAALLIVYALVISMFLFMRADRAGTPVLFPGLTTVAASAGELLDERLMRAAVRYELSEREREVARLYAQGRSRAFIGDQLGISENTVRDHVAHIYKKMGVHDKQSFIDKVESAG